MTTITTPKATCHPFNFEDCLPYPLETCIDGHCVPLTILQINDHGCSALNVICAAGLKCDEDKCILDCDEFYLKPESCKCNKTDQCQYPLRCELGHCETRELGCFTASNRHEGCACDPMRAQCNMIDKLVCREGICTCGKVDCPCTENEHCFDEVCEAGKCRCAALGCPCNEDSQCRPGVRCINNYCSFPQPTTIDWRYFNNNLRKRYF